MKTYLAPLSAALALSLTGCFGGWVKPNPNDSLATSDAIKSDTRMTLVELDQHCMSFGEKYLVLIGNACNHVEGAVDNPELRTRAHGFKLQAASSVYDIATGANPFAKLMDLILLAELQDLVWNREGLAEKIFGAPSKALTDALNEGRTEAWKLADKILKAEQRTVLESMIAEWRQAHPTSESVAFVRFSDFDQFRGKTVLDGVPLGSGLLAPLSEASKQIAETRLLWERSLYLMKRMPLLLRWHAESLMNSSMTRPEITELRKTANRFADVAEKMPENVAKERGAFFQSAEDRISHAGDEVRSVARFIALLVAGLLVLGFALAFTLRKLAPREAKAAAPAPAPKPRQPIND